MSAGPLVGMQMVTGLELGLSTCIFFLFPPSFIHSSLPSNSKTHSELRLMFFLSSGCKAKTIITVARNEIASMVGGTSDDILLTSGGTEVSDSE